MLLLLLRERPLATGAQHSGIISRDQGWPYAAPFISAAAVYVLYAIERQQSKRSIR